VVGAVLQEMRNYTHPDRTLVCYPNSGEVWDGISKTWASAPVKGSGTASEALCPRVDADGDVTGISAYVAEWYDAGARVIGGCCRTTPATVSGIRQALAAHTRAGTHTA
jgi:homocysteine S-methyltransferase